MTVFLNKMFICRLLCLELQINTQRYGRRPFGVGLLVAGYDVNYYLDAFIYSSGNMYGSMIVMFLYGVMDYPGYPTPLPGYPE